MRNLTFEQCGGYRQDLCTPRTSS